MLEPRETDIPTLFLVLVVLPLVSYILLGKWNEAAKKKERVGLLAQRAAEEAHKTQTMSAVSITPIPLVPLPSSATHQCARCHSPATTRCSQCKSVRYWYVKSSFSVLAFLGPILAIKTILPFFWNSFTLLEYQYLAMKIPHPT